MCVSLSYCHSSSVDRVVLSERSSDLLFVVEQVEERTTHILFTHSYQRTSHREHLHYIRCDPMGEGGGIGERGGEREGRGEGEKEMVGRERERKRVVGREVEGEGEKERVQGKGERWRERRIRERGGGGGRVRQKKREKGGGRERGLQIQSIVLFRLLCD